MQPPSWSTWLAQTKLHPPQSRADVIPRPQLRDCLFSALSSHPLTLVSAPAGYGKTTLLAELCSWGAAGADAAPYVRSQAPRLAAAWVSLGEEDNDATHFLLALIAALRCLRPGCGATALALLQELPNPAAQTRQIAAALINDIIDDFASPFVLVLDDVHLLGEPAVFFALDYLITHAPAQMRVAIGTRHDPPLSLARLRARGELAELRLVDLRFTIEETMLFLNGRHGLALSPADLASVQTRTEGWPAGLRLLAASLERMPAAAERQALIADLLAHPDRSVFDFLAAEVFNHQPPELRRFLLQTAILDELTPDLCQAVSGAAHFADLLEDAQRRNLFLVEMQPGSYRYHALFGQFLQQELERALPGQRRDLHRRAAAASAPDRAIRHLLAAELWEEAAIIIEAMGDDLLQRGLLETLAGWIQALPPAVREARPQLLYLQASCAWERGDLDGAFALLQQALAGFERAGDQAGEGRALVDLANCAMMRVDVAASAAFFERALAHPLTPRRRVQALMGRAGLNFFGNDHLAAAADFAAATTVMETAADADVLRRLLSHLTAGYAALPGGGERMERILRQARRHFGDQISPTRVIIEELTAVLHIWRGELRQAIQAGEMTLAVKERLGGSYPFVGVDAATIVVDCYSALGQYAAAEQFVPRLFERVAHVALVERMRVASSFVVARSYWLQGRLAEVREWYDRMCAAQTAQELPMDAGFRARVRGMLALSEGRLAEAERAFGEAVAIEERERFGALFGSSRVLLAHFYTVRNRPKEALAALAPILAEAEQRGMPGLIVLYGTAALPPLRLAVAHGVHADFAARLLRILTEDDGPRTLFVPETGETLTVREVEVLARIVNGASNRAIAQELAIGEGTVKSHVHHILAKLGVRSRSEAAVLGRRLGLGG